MRFEIKIIAAGLMLSPVQARVLLVEIDSFEGLDYVEILTGHSYDSNIEKDGDDSEDPLTTITIYADGEEESVSDLAAEVMDRINELHEIRNNGLFFTLTDVNSIVQYK